MEFADLMPYAYRLRFPDQLEHLFQADYERKSIAITRIGLALGIVLVGLFGLLDIWAAPLALNTIWIIRYLVISPVLGAVLLLTFTPFFARMMQPLILLAVVTAGLGIAAMSGVTSPQEAAYASYYVGLLLVIMWGYTFIRLRFWYATFAGLIIVAGYEIVAIGYQQLLTSAMGQLAFATSNFFFVAANILGMFAGYFIELYTRRDFLQRRLLQDDALRAIAAGTAAKTGDDFLQSLVAQLASALHVRYAYLTERVDGAPSRLRVLANWENGAFGPNEEYDLAGTPCADVIGGQVCFYPQRVQALFPEDADLVALGAQSYLGVPLVDGTGAVLGHLVVMDDQPLAAEDRPRYETILQIFAARAAAELVRQHADARLYQAHEELERRVVERTAQLEAALAERTRLADILEATSDMVAFATLDGTILYFNRAGRHIAGLPDDADITQFSFADFYPPAALELLGTVGIPTALRDGTWSGETMIKTLQGGEVPVSLVGIVHRAPDGSPTHLSAILRDISERKRVEEALQRSKEAAEEATRAKSTFLANMSHEIRTPMNGIIGMTDLLLDTNLGFAQRDFVETIRTSGDALLTIINDILDFSKIEAGKLDLDAQPFDLRRCIESALDVLAHRAAEKGLDLAAQFDANTPAAIVGDEVRLRQILVNLLGNAIKFTEQGEVIVSVRSQEPASDHLHSALCTLQFSVKDTGIGIPPDRIDQLFQSFSQVDASTTRKYGGTGLGLVISQRLAELMGGRMWVESAPGQGSTFFFNLRASTAPDAPPVYLRGDQPQLRGKHLLVVDDTPTNRAIVCHQVASWGMTCEQAASGAAALALLQAGQVFDLAILDMDMPGMDGLELAQAIRRWESGQEARMADGGSRMETFDPRSSIFDPQPARLPLVMLTSLGQRPLTEHERVFAALLTKPVKASQLYNALVAVFMEHDPAGSTGAEQTQTAFDTQLGARLPLRILLAEDNPINQKVALLALERLGYIADVAANGQAAIEAIERQPYDMVLMDVHMPVLDGLQATRRIRANRNVAGGRQPRIIAMTANAMQGDRELCLAAGMDDYIAKPVHIHELRAAIERAAGQPLSDAPAVVDGAAELEPAVDWAALAEFGRAGATDELIALFLADAPATLAALQAAVAHQDAAGLHQTAHSLKGSSSYMGAHILAARLADLERIGRGGSVDGAVALLAQVEREFVRVRRALTKGQLA